MEKKISEIKPESNKTVLGRLKNMFDKALDKISADKNPDKEKAPETPREAIKIDIREQIKAAGKKERID